MKNYKLLIIAWYANIAHVSEFILNLKKVNPNVDISLLSSRNISAIPMSVINNTSEIICSKYTSKTVKNKLILGIIDRLFFMKAFFRLSKRSFDIVNIHYAKPRLYYVMHWIQKITNNIVISPWGSDVFRVEGKRNIQLLCKIYERAQFVTVGKDSQVGQQLISQFQVAPEKFFKLEWGGEFFDYLLENSTNISSEGAKARFGLEGRYVITCGYNTQKEQRHEEIIDAIYRVKNQLPDNLTLLFPFTYGRTVWNNGYTGAVIEKGRRLGFDIVAIEEHLSLPDLFKLRMATDIFVHVQTTDARSRCVMEYVACNKKVVHGAWVKYAYLEDNHPSCYFPVNRMEELGECIVDAYHAKIEPLPQAVTDCIMERGWKHTMFLWNSFFESLI